MSFGNKNLALSFDNIYLDNEQSMRFDTASKINSDDLFIQSIEEGGKKLKPGIIDGDLDEMIGSWNNGEAFNIKEIIKKVTENHDSR